MTGSEQMAKEAEELANGNSLQGQQEAGPQHGVPEAAFPWSVMARPLWVDVSQGACWLWWHMAIIWNLGG